MAHAVKHWLKARLGDGISVVFLGLSALWSRFGNFSKPRVVWGPTPLKPIAWNSRALRRAGIASWTSVDTFYPINRAEDFEEYLESFLPPVSSMAAVVLRNSRYVRFHSLLQRFNVFITCFDGGFLRDTRLRFLEHIFLRLGKKKLIVWPYGADTYVPSSMHDPLFRDGLLADYPMLAQTEEHTLQQIRYFCKHADFIIGNVPHDEALPRKDVLTIACYCVDTIEWAPVSDFRHIGDGTTSQPPVKIFHCPNHRNVKGTAHFVAAYEALLREGLNVQLEIVEQITNDEIRIRMQTADIVAAQCLYGYAATEIEAMSLGKPVLSNLENRYYYDVLRQQSFLRFCPIVSVTPETLRAALRQLVLDPARRAQLGAQGRAYVEQFHSLSAQAKFWQAVIACVFDKTASTEVQHWWESSPI
jgi:glycosyltransferase involved in cell wall biosynthesis